MAAENLSQIIHHIDTVTVLSGQTTSFFVDLKGITLVGIETPAALTSAKISFRVTPDPIIIGFCPYFNAAGSLVEVNIGVDRFIGLLPADFAPVRFIQIVTDVVEGADRVFSLISRRIS